MTSTLYGIHPVLEALKKRPRAISAIMLARQHTEGEVREIIDLAHRNRIPLQYDEMRSLSRSAGTEQHQGVTARAEPFPLAELESVLAGCRSRQEQVFFLVLDAMQDPQNVGALIRSAVCSGVQAVIFPKDRSAPLTGAVAKASAGAIEHISLCRVVNIAATLEDLKKENIWVVGTSPGAEKNIYAFDFRIDMALVIGSEGKGMRPLVAKKCDFTVAIPLRAGFESLNASAAGAVVLFEAMRQRNYKNSTE
jgi:23S rRNA (guanosine2251-2'-O)-methyltransferase